MAQLTFSERAESNVSRRDFSRQLISKGYREAITYSFIDPETQALFDPQAAAVELLNPIASDMGVMRSSILPGLVVAAAVYNLNRQQTRLKLFETGLGFQQQGEQLDQSPLLAGTIGWSKITESWLSAREATVQKSQNADLFDFYDIKSDVESLLGLSAEKTVQFSALDPASPMVALHPGQSAAVYLGQQLVGYVGQLHPQLQKKLNIDQEIWVFELQLNLISTKKVPEFKVLSKFPEVRRDLAIVVDTTITAGEVVDVASKAAGEYLVATVVFDQYSGAGIDRG